MQELLRAWRRWLPVLVVVAAAFGVGLTVDDLDGDGTPDRIIIEREFKTADPSGPAPPIAVDTDNQVQADEQHEAEESAPAGDEPASPDLHEDMRDETPPGVTQQEVNEGREQTEALADEQLGAPRPPAGAQAYSCPQRLVRNRSSLSGPRVGTALHFTVSDPGSLDAIRGLFNTPSFGASSNYGIELSGRCQQWVPKGEKAWAQGAGNSAYFSIEIVTKDRSRASWLASPLIKNGILAALVRDLNRSIGAPLKRVDPSGCAWPAGITDHDALECGNTHWDVGKNFPWDVFMRQVKQGVKLPIRAVDRKRCRHIHRFRGRSAKVRKANQRWQDRRKRLVSKRGLHCVKGKPVRKGR